MALVSEEGKISREEVLAFIRQHHLAVIATADLEGSPEAALINIAVTPEFEIIFETTNATRKFVNLRRNPDAALVIGWDKDQTLQCSGIVDEPEGRQLDRLKSIFLSAHPDYASHEFWPGNHYFRLTPRWVRFSNYNQPRRIAELDLADRPAGGRKRRGIFSKFPGMHLGFQR